MIEILRWITILFSLYATWESYMLLREFGSDKKKKDNKVVYSTMRFTFVFFMVFSIGNILVYLLLKNSPEMASFIGWSRTILGEILVFILSIKFRKLID